MEKTETHLQLLAKNGHFDAQSQLFDWYRGFRHVDVVEPEKALKYATLIAKTVLPSPIPAKLKEKIEEAQYFIEQKRNSP